MPAFPVEKATAVDKIKSAIIFGEYGTGKTILGASADEIDDYSPVLIVDVEGSAAGVGRLYPEVDIARADTLSKLEFIVDELVTKNEGGYKTVVVDTLNVAQNLRWGKAVTDNPGNKFGAYDDLKYWTMDFVRKLHAADFMVIFIAHPQQDKDETTGKVTMSVKLAGSARAEVPTVPDLIGFLEFVKDENEKTVRVLRVGRSTRAVTKNRFGLADTIWPSEGKEGPTIYDIQAAIIEARG